MMRAGIIGTGSMGKNHLRVVNSMPEYELTSAMDTNAENLKTAAEQYDLEIFTDFREMLPYVDVVMVSSPTTSHFEIASFFIENGKHVLIEKPLAASLQEADELIALADKHNVVMAVGHLERFNPAVEYIEDIVKTPRFIEVQRLGSFSPRSLDVDVILDLMIHDLDIIMHWDRSGVKQVNASGIPIISKKIDIANVRIEFNSGLVANVTASRVSQKKTRKLRIFQENCYISLDYQKKRVKYFTLAGMNFNEEIPEIKDVEPLYNLWKNFHKTITEGKNYNVTGQDARDALALALQISESIRSV